MSAHTLRRSFMRNFSGLRKNARATAIAILAGYTAELFGAVALGHWLLQRPPALATVLPIAALMLFIGTRLRGFNNIVHECSHATFTERRQDNVLYGSYCAAMVFGCFRDYRDDHLTHHAHLGDYAQDRDLQGIRALRLEAALTPRTVLRHMLTPILGLHFRYYLRIDLSARDGRAFLALKLALVAATLALAWAAPLTALLFVLIPFLWIFTALNYWTDCIDHGGLLDSGDELTASRNVPLPLPLRVVLFPRNDCFHLVHHLFPQVPSQHLEACHRQLLAHSDYPGQPQPPRHPAPAIPAE